MVWGRGGRGGGGAGPAAAKQRTRILRQRRTHRHANRVTYTFQFLIFPTAWDRGVCRASELRQRCGCRAAATVRDWQRSMERTPAESPPVHSLNEGGAQPTSASQAPNRGAQAKRSTHKPGAQQRSARCSRYRCLPSRCLPCTGGSCATLCRGVRACAVTLEGMCAGEALHLVEAWR